MSPVPTISFDYLTDVEHTNFLQSTFPDRAACTYFFPAFSCVCFLFVSLFLFACFFFIFTNFDYYFRIVVLKRTFRGTESGDDLNTKNINNGLHYINNRLYSITVVASVEH